MKVAWICDYSLSELDLNYNRPERPTPWLSNTAFPLAKMYNIDLNIISIKRGLMHSMQTKKNGIRFHFIRTPFPLPLRLSWFYINDFLKLKKCLKSIQPDLIHAHGTEGENGFLAILQNYPIIVSLQGIINHIYTAKMSIQDLNLAWKFLMPLQRKMELFAIKHADCVIAKSSYSADFAKQFITGAKVRIIPDPVGRHFLEFTPNKANQIPVVSFVGPAINRKGIFTFLNAIAKVQQHFLQVKMMIITTTGLADDDRKRIIAYARNLGILGRIFFMGQVDHIEMPEFLQRTTVHVHPSYFDNFPNAVIEAMALGKPVVASKVGGIPFIIDDGRTGFLCKAGDVNAFADNIIELLKNPHLRFEIGRNARQEVCKRFSPDKICQQLYQTYKEVIG